MRSTDSIVKVLVALELLDESKTDAATRVIDAVMSEADDEPQPAKRQPSAVVAAVKAATKAAVASRRIEPRIGYWLTKKGLKASDDDANGISNLPVFKVIRKRQGLTKWQIAERTGFERGVTENAIYTLQTRGLVESRAL